MILDLDARLEPMGYTRTTVPPMELETPSAALHIVQGIGTAALLVLLFDLFFLVSRRTSLLLLALAALGMTGLAVLKPASYPLLLSMAGGIVMPSIAAVGLCRVMLEKRREAPRPGLGRLLGACRGHGADCHRDGALRLAACLRRALAALLHSGD